MIFIYKTFSYTLFLYLKQKNVLYNCIHTHFHVIIISHIYIQVMQSIMPLTNHLTMHLSWSLQEIEIMSLQHCSIHGSTRRTFSLL